MNQLTKKILGSLDNAENGASGKKLTALAITVFCVLIPTDVYVVWAWLNNDWSLFTGLMVIYTGLVATLFGINVVDKYKNSNNTESKE
jgi:membrane protein YdbS with pleckstrin-like domain